MQLNLNRIAYTYPDSALPAISDLSVTFPEGWTAIVGDNGCGKTTLVRLACGLIQPEQGAIAPQLVATYCEQDSSQPPECLYDFAADWGRLAVALRRDLGIQDDWPWRYETLSGGQQKRLQIACALWQEPDVLALDEPTNDLDAPTRQQVARALTRFKGIGLLVSHDRELLDTVASRCLMHEGGRFVMRPGSYSQAAAQAQQDREALLHEREQLNREKKRLEAEAARRRAEADKSRTKRSKRALDLRDSDGRGRIGRAIVTGKDGVAGKLASAMDERLAKAAAQLDATKVEKRYAGRFRDYGSPSPVTTLMHLEAGCVQAGDFQLAIPELWIGPRDHIVLTGGNGQGKSLLVREVVSRVRDGIALAYVPQAVDDATRQEALRHLDQLDDDRKGTVLSIVGGLNSDPKRLRDGNGLSPGETKKLLLALQLVDDPNLLILDEPTNHLDIASAEALVELMTDFPGAYLLVTHDTWVQDALEATRWRIQEEAAGRVLTIRQ